MSNPAATNSYPSLLRPFAPRPQISHVVFDFDGTLSWLRHGWPEIMLNLFLEYFPIRPGDDLAAIKQELITDILSLNGQPTVFQMRSFVERALAKGGRPPKPEELLVAYQFRLDEVIDERTDRIKDGSAFPDHFVVFGARALLRRLAELNVTLYVLSGTHIERVLEEAALLQLADFFEDRIFGSPADATGFSKRMVFDRILAEEGIRGDQLLSFGDGPVEIHHTSELGGIAVGVASDEDQNGSGQCDPWKEKQLTAAGAHMMLADYRDPDAILDQIFGAPPAIA